ncbi:MAG: hypothetical protein WBO17_09755 [Sphingorhabdus sp.]
MSAQALEQLIESQAALIAALDSGDVAAIELATQQMASAVETVRHQDAWHEQSTLGHLDHAMKQSQAARIRVNYLSEWTRQKIDHLGEIRGINSLSNRATY